jgi:hypothetical protein
MFFTLNVQIPSSKNQIYVVSLLFSQIIIHKSIHHNNFKLKKYGMENLSLDQICPSKRQRREINLLELVHLCERLTLTRIRQE